LFQSKLLLEASLLHKVDQLKIVKGKDSLMVVVGASHMEYGFGIPEPLHEMGFLNPYTIATKENSDVQKLIKRVTEVEYDKKLRSYFGTPEDGQKRIADMCIVCEPSLLSEFQEKSSQQSEEEELEQIETDED
jgi:hypothetical protein